MRYAEPTNRYAVRSVRGATIAEVTFEAEKLMIEYQEYWRVLDTNMVQKSESGKNSCLLWYMIITLERR
jgi:hypothetical protein